MFSNAEVLYFFSTTYVCTIAVHLKVTMFVDVNLHKYLGTFIFVPVPDNGRTVAICFLKSFSPSKRYCKYDGYSNFS